jgi:hypothetical protein
MEFEMSESKLDQAVFQILRMTHEGQLVWRHEAVPGAWLQGTDDAYPIYFEAEYRDRKLALFQRRRRTNPIFKRVAEVAGGAVEEWNQSTHLALLGNNDEILYEFPSSRPLHDLFDAVRYKEARVDEFLDELIGSNVTSEKE